MPSLPPHARFIRAVHRRLVIVRAAEHLGRCILAGCAVALLLLPILLWRHQSVMPPLIGIGAACLLAVGAMMVHRWPSEMKAAEEADQQLHLADLLATTLQLRPIDPLPAPDLLADAVRAMADARCRGFSPSQVALHRLGIRAWSGIGLSVALVLTLAFIPFQPARSDAADANGSILAPASAPPTRPTDQALASQPWAQPLVQNENDSSSEDASRMTLPDSSDTKSTASVASDSSSHPRAGTGGDSATNGGASQTKSRPASPHKPSHTNIAGSPNQAGGVVAGGIGAGNNQGIPGSATGFSAGTSAASHVIPPWQITGWPQARQAADQALTDGQIPDEYHDLVRDYFNRP